MLPPMAIFFPLFTLLEDWGLLPRIAFNLDKCFQCCHACGKQALCMCMGLGCNAVGVTGCRIIQSPRERLIAILTNALMPCNGRFPTLMTLITLFVLTGNGPVDALLGAAVLCGVMVLCVLATLLLSRLLSVTLLKGLPSAFALELPPFRRPKIGDLSQSRKDTFRFFANELQPLFSTSNAYLMMAFSLISSFCSSRVMRPSRTTSTRSLMEISSGISEETMIMDFPSAASRFIIL